MKILVLSDSHGNISNMEAAVEREQPRMILHLGDCWRDAERLAERYPEIPMEHVPGNCDCRPEEPAEKLLFLGDCRGGTRRSRTIWTPFSSAIPTSPWWTGGAKPYS